MAAKQQQNFVMWAGTHKNVTFTVLDASSASKDLTSASVTFVISDESNTGSLLKLNTDSGSGVTVSGCTYTVSMSPAHTAGCSGTYHHESRVRDTATNQEVVAVGSIKINVSTTSGS